jgi:hypothetical protein
MEYLEDGTITYKHTRRDKLRTIFVIVTKRTDVKTSDIKNKVRYFVFVIYMVLIFNQVNL